MENKILTVNETNLEQLRHLCEKYPASSVSVFFYLKMLQILRQEEYQTVKSVWLLHILNRTKFAEFSFDDIPGNTTQSPALQHTTVSAGVDTSANDQNRIISRLISEFSVTTPKIRFDPEKHDGSINYGKSSLVEDPDIVSETLAMFYHRQGYSGKAIKIYKKLCLLFPEKSCYFAAQISAIKNSKN